MKPGVCGPVLLERLQVCPGGSQETRWEARLLPFTQKRQKAATNEAFRGEKLGRRRKPADESEL